METPDTLQDLKQKSFLRMPDAVLVTCRQKQQQDHSLAGLQHPVQHHAAGAGLALQWQLLVPAHVQARDLHSGNGGGSKRGGSTGIGIGISTSNHRSGPGARKFKGRVCCEFGWLQAATLAGCPACTTPPECPTSRIAVTAAAAICTTPPHDPAPPTRPGLSPP